jgi:hypothetical protein
MAAGNTYVPIFTETLASTQASVTFSSIPSTYTDLVLVVSGLAYYSSSTFIAGDIVLNGDTGNNYSSTIIQGYNSANSSRYTSVPAMRQLFEMTANSTDNSLRSTGVMHFMNYANTTNHKTALGRSGSNNSAAGAEVIATVSLWRSTAAINSIQIKNADSGTGFVAGTFSLYGITAA